MMDAVNFSQFFVFVWLLILFVWLMWVIVKAYQFFHQSKRQQAVSRPQLNNLKTRILKSSFLVCVFLSLILIFASPDPRENITVSLYFSSICFSGLAIAGYMVLWSNVLNLKVMGLQMTDMEEVPTPPPSPPTPPPHDGKNFSQLSEELSKELEQLEK